MKRIVLIVFFIAIGVFFVGCKNQKIQFNRESGFSKVMESLQFDTDKPTVKKSSGIIIYRDEPQKQPTQQARSGFGPADINFDLPIKF